MGEWKRVKLGDVADYVTDKSEVMGLALEDYISTENMLPNKGGISLASSVPSYGSVTEFCQGDVLVSNIRPYFKKIWKATRDGFCSNDILALRVKNCICDSFLFSALSNDVFFDYVMASAKGTKMPRGDKQQILEYPILLPPLPTQRKIAAVLSSLDDKIENNRKICANLEAQAQAIFKSWFVDFEPFGGKMPQGWKMGRLGDVAIYRQGKIAANELTAETYYSTENMLPDKQGLMPATSLPQIGEVPVCEKGDVLISNIRPYFKKICFSWSHGGHSPDVLCLAAKNDNMRYWLYRQLWDDAFFAYVMSSAKGTKMPRGDKEQILAYGMAIPNENDVARFNAVIEPMCESIVSKRIESRALAATRDALLPKLMSGEIDVEKVSV